MCSSLVLVLANECQLKAEHFWHYILRPWILFKPSVYLTFSDFCQETEGCCLATLWWAYKGWFPWPPLTHCVGALHSAGGVGILPPTCLWGASLVGSVRRASSHCSPHGPCTLRAGSESACVASLLGDGESLTFPLGHSGSLRLIGSGWYVLSLPPGGGV